jgi:integrase
MGRLYEANRAEKIWQDADINAFCAVASRPLQDALVLALCTGQRQGDLLRLTWAAYDGASLRLRQRKRGAAVTMPVSGTLKALLDARKGRKRGAVTILTNTEGKPWTEDGFRSSWAKAFAKAKLGDLHFHDLRGTAVTRLALAGCTIPEIAAITGHSPDDAGKILRAHYLGGQAELAESAIVKSLAKYG